MHDEIMSTRHTTFGTAAPAPSVEEWLAQRSGYQWLLAHGEPRVVWGRYAEDGWHLAHPLPDWRWIHSVRLFGDDGECLLEHVGNEWIERIIHDDEHTGSPVHVFDQPYLLWGTVVDGGAPHGFTTVREGSQGLLQTLPLVIAQAQLAQRRAYVQVRHYLAQDSDSGIVRIATSRLRTLACAAAGPQVAADPDDSTT